MTRIEELAYETENLSHTLFDYAKTNEETPGDYHRELQEQEELRHVF